MDEFLFHISTQLETLQIQASVAAQRGQQWIAALITQCSRLLEEIYNEQHIQNIKDVIQRTLAWVQDGFEQLLLQYRSFHFNFRGIYQQFRYSYFHDISRRDVMFCLAGLTVGTLLGYILGDSWNQWSHHMHHMKAIICHTYIGIEGVSMVDDAEMPVIKKSNDLLIQVRAASVNVIDAKICSGYSKVYRRLLNSGRHRYLPVTLGRDCAGIVVDIGKGVINFDIGDEVFLAVPSWAPGTMAEYLVVPETIVVKRPKMFSFEAAASIPYNGCMAWDAIVNTSVIKEGDAKGKRVLVFGGNTPVGCILIQLVKLWGGYVVTACTPQAVPIMRALGADEIIPLCKSDIEKELELHDKYDAIFYTGVQPIEEHVLKRHLLPYGSFVSTVPEQLISDSLGFICGSIFAGCVRIKLLVQYMFGFNMLQWREGSKINVTCMQALSDLADANQLQLVLDSVYAPHNIEHALHRVLDPNSVGSTIIKFQ